MTRLIKFALRHGAHAKAARGPESGSVIVLTAVGMMVLLIMAAFAVDLGHWYSIANQQQRAADVAALGAVERLVEVEADTGDRATAEAAAEATARQLAGENGFSTSDPDTAITVSISTAADGSDRVSVSLSDSDVGLFFAQLVLDNVSISRDGIAAIADCQAVCTGVVLAKTTVDVMVDAGSGGDGWRPTLAGDLIFNLFHHNSGEVLSCVNSVTERMCEPGGDTDFYPIEPYLDIETNYTPKLAAIDTEVYFVVQTSTSVGLGCWDGDTHARCAGYESPVLLENYLPNSGSRGNVRMDGPEVVGDRLFMYGDNNYMYCIVGPTGDACSGYPKPTPLAGVHDMELVDPGVGMAEGVEVDEVQFDMEPTPSRDMIFTSLTPVPGTPAQTWISCWDTVNDTACSGFTPAATEEGRPFLFFSYTTGNELNGVCARAGHSGGGSGVGHQCFDLSGAPVPSPLDFDFDVGDGKPTQQSATGMTTFGHLRTFFPYRGIDGARCWDWTIDNECDITVSNWSSENTEDYAYIYDGNRCMYGLGHTGFLWTFDIDTGKWPCPGDASGEGSLYPCACGNGSDSLWTYVVLTEDTNLDLFESFNVTVTFPDGSPFWSGDLTTMERPIIDLHPLNDLVPRPTEMKILIEGEVLEGYEGVAIGGDIQVGVRPLDGKRPVLVD